MPNADDEFKAITARRQQYQYQAGYREPWTPPPVYAPSVSEDQNTADVARYNQILQDRANAEAQQRAAAAYASGAPGIYKDPSGRFQTQDPTLLGLAGGLSDPGSASSVVYNWNGRIGGAQADIDRARQMGMAADNRGPVQANYGQADQTRGSQYHAMGMYQDAALGRGPSAAQGQFQQGLDRSMSANMALANSARGGPMGLAQGRIAAMSQNANMLAAATAQAAQLRAKEMQDGMRGFADTATLIRGQDINAAQANAAYALGSRAQNDARAAGYETLGFQVETEQMKAQRERHNAFLQAMGVQASAKAQDAALQANNQQNSENNMWKGVGIGATVGGGIIGAALPMFAPKSDGAGKSESHPGGSLPHTNADEVFGSEHGSVGTSSYRPGLYGGGNAGAPAPAPAKPKPASGIMYRGSW